MRRQAGTTCPGRSLPTEKEKGGSDQMISSEPSVQKTRKMLGGVKNSKTSSGRFVRERESSSSSRSSAGEMMIFCLPSSGAELPTKVDSPLLAVAPTASPP